MTNKEAIKILSMELSHTESHMEIEGKATEYYKEMSEIAEALRVAINALEESKIIELFNKYDILLVHIDGKIVPVKNSTKQECYNLLYDIQELIEWRKILFNKHLDKVYNNG